MDSEKVMQLAQKYMGKQSKAETPKTETEAKVDEPVVETKEEPAATGAVDSTKATEVSNTEDPGATVTEPEAQPAEEVQKAESKPSFTRQEQVNHAFQKEKAKRKALEQKYAALSKELETLKAKMPSDTDFQKDPRKFIDDAVDVKSRERELQGIQESIRESQYAEYTELNEQRIANCFPDENERARFKGIIEVEGPKLLHTLDERDPEQAVLSFLDDSEIAPLVTRILIAEPKYLEEVLSKRSPYGKYAAMKELENRIVYARTKIAEGKPQETKGAPEAKPEIPVVGSVTKSDATKDTKTVFNPNEILHRLNQKHRYTHS